MTNREAFEIWAPKGCRWAPWVRPVPFIMKHTGEINQIMNYEIPAIDYLNEMQTDTAIFLDLPGYESIKEGLSLAELGWRPIPLYNGTNEQQGAAPLIENHGIERALIWGAHKLKNIEIKKDAPPVFLLDSNRMHRFKPHDSYFDNSWDIYSQDIPSAKYFLNNGIYKIIVRGETINEDMAKILFEFQQKTEITILFTQGYETPQEVLILRPARKSGEGSATYLASV